MLSEDGRLRISNSSKRFQYYKRDESNIKILEIYLDNFGSDYYIYNGPNEYLETRRLQGDWSKIKRVLNRNKNYIERGVAPKHVKETTPGAWSCILLEDIDITFAVDLIKNRLSELNKLKTGKSIKKDYNKQFDQLYDQWLSIMKTFRKFPITTGKVLDEFYSNNPEFQIARTKTEKRRLFLKRFSNCQH